MASIFRPELSPKKPVNFRGRFAGRVRGLAARAQTLILPDRTAVVLAPVPTDDKAYQIASKFNRAWTSPAFDSLTVRAVLCIIVAAICLSRALIGLKGMQSFSHDAFMMLDGAWRMLNGQRPHIDFSTNVGTLAYVPTAIGLWMAHYHAQGFGYGQALAGFLLTVWAYILGRRRLSGLLIALFCLAMCFIATAPSALGFSPLRTSPGMTYNRYTYAFIALLLLEALNWRDLSIRSRFWGGVSTGAVTAILLFLKITGFACAVFLLLALFPCERQTKARWRGILIGFLSLSAAMCAYFSFNMWPMVRDMITLAGARHFWFEYRVDAIFQDAMVLSAYAIAAGLLVHARGDRRGFSSLAIAGIAVSVAGACLILGNYEFAGFPLAVFLVILATERATAHPIKRSSSLDLFHASVLLIGSAFIVGSLASGAIAMSNGLYRAVWKARNAPRMNTPTLSGFVPVGADQWYTGYINDGIKLLRIYRRPGDTVMSLDFTNPFSFGLALPPAPGGATVLQYRSTFDDTHRLSAQRLFGGANLVMLPKRFSDPTLAESIYRLYGKYLAGHFILLGESKWWYIYRGNSTVN